MLLRSYVMQSREKIPNLFTRFLRAREASPQLYSLLKSVLHIIHEYTNDSNFCKMFRDTFDNFMQEFSSTLENTRRISVLSVLKNTSYGNKLSRYRRIPNVLLEHSQSLIAPPDEVKMKTVSSNTVSGKKVLEFTWDLYC